MNILEISKQFKTESECVAYLEQWRWPNGVRCVICGTDKVKSFKSTSKKQAVRWLYQCNEPTCRYQFSAKTGTLFHDSHLPLQKWFMAMALVCEAKKGISAHQVARTIGVQYRTAWYMCHRIRAAMKMPNQEPLNGVVEVDEMFVGGKHRGQGMYARNSKLPVMGAIKRGGELRYQHVEKVRAKTVKPFLNKHVSPAAQMVCTDESVVYPNLLKDFEHRHQTVNHSKGEFVRHGLIYTNTIENAFSLFKRGFIGSFHKLSKKHLHRYLAEFETRFNNRKNKHFFEFVLGQMAANRPLQYKILVG